MKKIIIVSSFKVNENISNCLNPSILDDDMFMDVKLVMKFDLNIYTCKEINI